MTPDPDAAEWRQIAASFAELAVERVREAFAWVDAELAASGSDGAVTLMLALSDWDGGMPQQLSSQAASFPFGMKPPH